MNSIDLEYLKDDSIGLVIAEGLAAVWEAQPEKPIQFLSDWLMKYEIGKHHKQQLEQHYEQLNEQKTIYREQLDHKKKQKEELKQLEEQQNLQNEEHLNNLCASEYLLDVIQELVPTILKEKISATQVYIGEVQYQTLPISDDNSEDYEAHLDKSKEQVIKYVGQSRRDNPNQVDMQKQQLGLKQGVTSGVFELQQDEPPNQEELSEFGGVQTQKKTQKFVFVPEVTKDPRVHYFRLPKLGSYLAAPLFFKGCLSIDSFNSAVEERISYIQALQEQEQEKQKLREEYEQKKAELENNQEELDALTQEFEANIGGFGEIQENEIPTYDVKYILCCDTLGQDRQFTPEQQQAILDIADRLRAGQEKVQREILLKDVSAQETYLREIGFSWETKLSEIDQVINESTRTFFLSKLRDEEPDIPEDQLEAKLEKLISDASETLHAEAEYLAVRELLTKNTHNLRTQFLALGDRRLLLFPEVLQNILYLLGYDRTEINEDNSHHLNWRKVRAELFSEELLQKFLEFNYRGPKFGREYKIYQKLNVILNVVDESRVKANDVYKFNLGYGLLLRLLRLVCQLRKYDIEYRREETIKFNDNIQVIIQQNQELDERRQKEKEDLYAEMEEKIEKGEEGAQDPETFNFDEWEKNWDLENPKAEIPQEKQFDQDDDCDLD